MPLTLAALGGIAGHKWMYNRQQEVLQALRRQPETARIPVIVISADATDEQIRRMRMLGVFDYLTKPFVVSNFVRVLNDVLQARAAR